MYFDSEYKNYMFYQTNTYGTVRELRSSFSHIKSNNILSPVLLTAPDFLFWCGPLVFVIRFSSLIRKNLKKLLWKSNIMIYLVPPTSDNKSASVTQQFVADLVTTHATGWKYYKVIKSVSRATSATSLLFINPKIKSLIFQEISFL